MLSKVASGKMNLKFAERHPVEGDMKKKRNHILFVILTTLLLVNLVACQEEEAEAPQNAGISESPVSEVNTLAISRAGTVSAEGEVVPLTSAQLSFRIGGNVAEILVEEGDELEAGDPIIRLDSEELENGLQQANAGLVAAQAAYEAALTELVVAESAVTRAEAGVTSAEANLALVRAGATQEELEAAEKNLAAAEASIVAAAGDRDAAVRVSDAEVQQAQARVAQAQAELESLQRTYDDILDSCFDLPDGTEVCPLFGPVEERTRAQLEAAKINLEAAQAAEAEARSGATPAERVLAGTGVGVAEASRTQAQAQLDLLLAGPRDEQIQQAEVGVSQAELALEQTQVQIQQAEAAVTQAEAEVTRAEAGVEAAQKALERATLNAPFDGAVGDIMTEVGELVAPGVPVVSFAEFDGWLVKTTDLTELDVVAVKNGLPATVRFDALPGDEVNGVVNDIASVASVVRGDVTYEVTVTLDESELPLRWGMTAIVDIDTES
jgi:HlyD family secretion protein